VLDWQITLRRILLVARLSAQRHVFYEFLNNFLHFLFLYFLEDFVQVGAVDFYSTFAAHQCTLLPQCIHLALHAGQGIVGFLVVRIHRDVDLLYPERLLELVICSIHVIVEFVLEVFEEAHVLFAVTEHRLERRVDLRLNFCFH